MKKTLLAISLAVFGASSVAADTPPSIEAFLGIDRTDWGGSRNIKDENGVDLGVGININSNWAVEGWYARSDTELKSDSSDIVVETASINGLRYLAEGQTRPFLTFGASHVMLNPENFDSDSESTVDLGLGLKHYFKNNMILRGDVIGRIFEDDQDDIAVEPTFRLSLGYAFGRSAPKTKHAVMAKHSAPVPPKAIEPPKDTDKDGIIDSKDQCPGTASYLKVNENGCEIKLTETVKIDLNIKFPNNSDVIPDQYLIEVQAVAKFMQQYADTVVEIHGYTDDRGKATYNQKLSEKRAKSVAAKLVSAFGVEANRVKAVGYGEQNPISDNTTAEGRAANRRVVAEISTRVEKTIVK